MMVKAQHMPLTLELLLGYVCVSRAVPRSSFLVSSINQDIDLNSALSCFRYRTHQNSPNGRASSDLARAVEGANTHGFMHSHRLSMAGYVSE